MHSIWQMARQLLSQEERRYFSNYLLFMLCLVANYCFLFTFYDAHFAPSLLRQLPSLLSYIKCTQFYYRALYNVCVLCTEGCVSLFSPPLYFVCQDQGYQLPARRDIYNTEVELFVELIAVTW